MATKNLKIYLCSLALLLTTGLNAQEGWKKEVRPTYSISYPDTWMVRANDVDGELTIHGPTPDFDKDRKHLGTTIFIETAQSEYSTMDSVAVAYMKKLRERQMLENLHIKQEEKINFGGVEAVEIRFTADVQDISTACRIILFQHNDIYYELSVTYDQKLSKKLVKEAFRVMETFAFIDQDN